MAINITDKTAQAIQTLVHDAFNTNATLDRVKTILMTNLACPNASNMVHKVAHMYSLNVADGIGDLIEGYNEPIDYGGIEKHIETYENVIDAFDKVLDVSVTFQNELNMASKIAFENGDIHIFQELLEIIEEHNKIVVTAIAWKDIADKFSIHPSFDTAIVSYGVPELEG